MNSNRLIFTNEVAHELSVLTESLNPSGLFILADTNTARLVYPRVADALPEAQIITVRAGDSNKNLTSLTEVWKALGNGGATRDSLLINLGGGMVTDLGGFAASTFKRGIRYINVPTSLLGAVDASVGGKTGINFNGLKNEVGTFSNAEAVIISSCFFDTLPTGELLSGFGEMIKHSLLSSPVAVAELLTLDICNVGTEKMLAILRYNITTKLHIVEQDPLEHGLRKALNLGHTAGHAFEALTLGKERPLPHGNAVAFGLVTELVISHLRCGFPSTLLHQIATFVRENYGPAPFGCTDRETLVGLMAHDKKNRKPSEIAFTLLSAPGQMELDTVIAPSEIITALDITVDLLG